MSRSHERTAAHAAQPAEPPPRAPAFATTDVLALFLPVSRPPQVAS
jgi:hypothetical protein